MSNSEEEPKKAPETLAERFWSVAKCMEGHEHSTEPQDVVRHVLAVLDAFEDGAVGEGLTRRTLSFLGLLRRAEIRGDVSYASPEQARGERVDERSLVFSVGVLLFERLTGRHPFGVENTPNRVSRIRKGEMHSGVNFFPSVPSDLRNILMRAMGPFPEERWPSLQAMRFELEAFMEQPEGTNESSETPAMLRGVEVDTASVAERDEPSVVVKEEEIPGVKRIKVVEGAELRAQKRREASEPKLDLAIPSPIRKESSDAFRMANINMMRRAAPALWAGIGATLTALLFILFSGPSEGVRSAAAEPKVAAAEAPALAAEVPPDDGTMSDVPVVLAPDNYEAEAPTEESQAPALVEAKPRPESFDPEYLGRQALAAAQECFVDGSGTIGVSLAFAKGANESRKVYLGGDKIPATSRKCLSDALVGVDAGGAADRPLVAVYTLRVATDASEYDFRRIK